MELHDAIEAVQARIASLLAGLAGALDLGPDFGPSSGGESGGISSGELEALLTAPGDLRGRLFLGMYDEADVVRAWEQHGIMAALRRRLGAGVRVRLSATEGLLRAYREDRPEGPDALVIEVKARMTRGVSDAAARAAGFPEADLLAIDWMLLQSPGEAFRDGRGPLPGQRWPGLGLSREVIGSILRATRRLGAAGALGTPMHYHLAVIYHRLFAFVDPALEGRFQALCRAMRGVRMAEQSRAVEEGRVREEGCDAPLRWEAREMLLPVTPELRAYLEAPAYREAAARALSRSRFTVAEAPPEGSKAAPPAAERDAYDVLEGKPWRPTSR